MAPRGSMKRSRQRLGATRRGSDGNPSYTSVKKKRRVETLEIDGVEIHEFATEVEMEYFTNLDEPLPRKTRFFRGFGDSYHQPLNLLRDFFNMRKHVFVANGGKSSNLEPIVDDPVNVPVLHSVPAASNVNDGGSGISAQIEEVITIESDPDSDDEVIMVSDPTAPIPLPRPCVCPHCGKTKKGIRHPHRSDSVKDSRVNNVPTDEVTIVTDEEVLREEREAPREDPPQPADAAVIVEDVAYTQAEDETEVHVVNDQPAPPKTANLGHADANVALSSREPFPEVAQEADSPLLVHRKFTLVGQKSHQPKRPPIKSQKNKIPAAIPGTVWLLSHETGKTIPLKLDGTKSRILPPSKKPAILKAQSQPSPSGQNRRPCNSSRHPNSFNYLAPGQTSCGKEAIAASSSPKFHSDDRRRTEQSSLQKGEQQKLPLVRHQDVPPKSSNCNVGEQRPVSLKLSPREPAPLKVISRVPKPVDAPSCDQVHNTYLGKHPVAVGGNGLKTPLQKTAPPNGTQLVAKLPLPQNNCILLNRQRTQALRQSVGQIYLRKGALDRRLVHSNKLKDSSIQASTSNVSLDPVLTRSPVEMSMPSPVVVEDATRAVVNGLVDFVSLREQFPFSYQYQYDEKRSEVSCPTAPCGELRCRMGCVCLSLSKKSVRRVRCNNVECIFGCTCKSHSIATIVNRHAKTAPNMKKLVGNSRRKQVLTILPDCSVESPTMGAGFRTQTPLKSFLPVQKVHGAMKTRQISDGERNGSVCEAAEGYQVGQIEPDAPCSISNVRKPHKGRYDSGVVSVPEVGMPSKTFKMPDRNLTGTHLASEGFHPIRDGLQVPGIRSTRSTSNGAHSALKQSITNETVKGLNGTISPPNGLKSAQSQSSTLAPVDSPYGPKLFPAPNRLRYAQAPNLTLPSTQPRSFFGREETPIPERALMCLTPGLGYVPLEEISPKVILRDPFKDWHRKSFLNVRQATEWLNRNLGSILDTNPHLMWVVTNKAMLAKKQLRRLCVDSLKNSGIQSHVQ